MRRRGGREGRTWTGTFQALSRLALATLALLACVSNAWGQRVHPITLLTHLAAADGAGEKSLVLPAVPHASPDGSLQLAIELEDEIDDVEDGAAPVRAPAGTSRSDRARSLCDPSCRGVRERASYRPRSNLEPGLPRGPPPA